MDWIRRRLTDEKVSFRKRCQEPFRGSIPFGKRFYVRNALRFLTHARGSGTIRLQYSIRAEANWERTDLFQSPLTRLDESPTHATATESVARWQSESAHNPKVEDDPVADPSQSRGAASKNTPVQIQLDEFIAVATRAALQVLSERQVELNPQPLPPGEAAAVRPGGRIITGIVVELD
jgi:hypothetical protein